LNIAGIELKEKRLFIAAAAAITAVVIIIYILLYAPLLARLGSKYTECRAMENQVMEARTMIEAAGRIYSKRVLPTEKDVAYTIEEITKSGQDAGINFISIKPKDFIKGKNPRYKVLPIEMKIEASAEQFINFISFLDDMERGLVKVKSFEIIPDKDDRTKLFSDLVLDMFVSTRESAGDIE